MAKKILDLEYQQYLSELNQQSSSGWPKIVLLDNNKILIISGNFIKSDNIFTLINRLYFLESKKNRILNNNLFDINSDNFFHIVDDIINIYSQIYNNKNHIEYSIIKKIYERCKFLKQIG